jgi:hypothetical protein
METQVMKRLLMLTAVAILTAAVGCSWFNRGSACNTCGPGMDQGQGYMSAPSVTTGPDATYLPAPG